MFGSVILRKRLATVLLIAAIGGVVAIGYARIVSLIDGLPFDATTLSLAVASGAITGALLGTLEFIFLPSEAGRRLRAAPFVTSVLLRAAIVTLLIFAGLVAANLIFVPGRFQKEGLEVVVRDVIAAFVLFLPVFFFLQMRRIVGGRVLRNFILGRYHRPVREARIFMFTDIANSTPLSQRLGDEGVHAMINRFFFDLSEPVARTGGEVHRFIGDEAVVTWPLGTPEQNARCLDCYFMICDRTNARAADYQRDFGAVPEFRTGLHGGSVVAGECGDEKQEIVYFGDTVNTASRIQGQCKELGAPLLISRDLLAQMDLPARYRAESLGNVLLRGRDSEMELFRIERA